MPQHQQRKSDHIRINLEEDVGFKHVSTGLERYRFTHCAMPDLDLEDVDTSVTLLGKRLAAPLIISSMTGGTPEAWKINRRLAEAAQSVGIGMGLGSQRAAIENPALADTYRVRQVAPDILLLANLGAVQLNYGYGPDECRRAVEMVEADGLILHLNPLQEALQPEGNTRFAGLLDNIGAVCRTLEVPVIVKEVGCGLAENVAAALVDAGVSALDVAGAGGTTWSAVERFRISDLLSRRVAAQFSEWGISTSESLAAVRRVAPDLPVVASGGIETGIDVAKCLALGATVCGLAWPLLRAALDSEQAVVDELTVIERSLRISMFCIGASDIQALCQTPHLQECSE